MANTQVVIEFTGDPSGLKPVADALTALGQLTKEQQQQFAKAAEDLKKRMEQIPAAAKQATAVLGGMSEALKGISTTIGGEAIKNGITQIAKFAGELEKATAKGGLLSGALKSLGTSSTVFGSITKDISGIKTALEIAKETTAGFGADGGNLEKAIQKLNTVTGILNGLKDVSKDLRTEMAAGLHELEGFIKQEQEKAEAVKKAEEEKQEAIKTTQEIIDTFFETQKEHDKLELEAKLEKLKQQQDAELANVNLTEGQKAAIKEKYRQQEANLKRQQFQKDKAAAIVQAIIHTALAVIKALPNYINAALAGIAGAAEIAVIAAQPVPQFAKGTEFVDGPGTATSDSITARLSKGERVVPAGINAQLKGITNDMLPQLAAYANMIPDIPQSALNQLALSHSLQLDYNKMADAFADKLAKNPMLQVSIDKNGIQTLITKGNRRTTMLNAKYRN